MRYNVGLAIIRSRARFPGVDVLILDNSVAHEFGASTGVDPMKQNRERLLQVEGICASVSVFKLYKINSSYRATVNALFDSLSTEGRKTS